MLRSENEPGTDDGIACSATKEGPERRATRPALRVLCAAANGNMAISKVDHELQIVYGEVYAPGFPDSQGDYMTRETIREMAFEFMRKGLGGNIDVQHSQEQSGAYVVESFIARDDDSVFIPGSWVIGVKVPDPELWAQIKSGELNGFSLDGKAMRVDSVLEIDMPDFLRGETEADGRAQPFLPRPL